MVSRRGFTLLEVIISSLLLTIVVSAASALLFVTARAVPAGDDPVLGATETLRAMDMLASELAFATSLNLAGPAEVEFIIRDRDGDGADDVIRYAWSGIAGDPWTRTLAGRQSENIVRSLQALTITYEISTNGTHMLGATLTAMPVQSRSSQLQTTIRLVNRPPRP